MKGKIIISTILIVLAIVSSFAILNADGFFNKKVDNKVLSSENVISTPIVWQKKQLQ